MAEGENLALKQTARVHSELHLHSNIFKFKGNKALVSLWVEAQKQIYTGTFKPIWKSNPLKIKTEPSPQKNSLVN